MLKSEIYKSGKLLGGNVFENTHKEEKRDGC